MPLEIVHAALFQNIIKKIIKNQELPICRNRLYPRTKSAWRKKRKDQQQGRKWLLGKGFLHFDNEEAISQKAADVPLKNRGSEMLINDSCNLAFC